MQNTLGFWRFARKFDHESNSSKTFQALIGSAEGVCGRSLFAKQEIFPSAVSQIIFLLEADTLKS